MRKQLIELLTFSSGELALETILIRLLASAALAIFIYVSYWLSHAGSVYSKKFNISLIGLTVLTTTVMIVIGNNLALSLGMVGALSIVRFRTAIKDSRDTVYIFWTIVVGICCGAGDYRVAGLGSALIFILLLLFGRMKNDDRMLLILRAARTEEEHIEALFFQRFARKAAIRVKNTTESSVEFIYEVKKSVLDKDRKQHVSITDEVYALGGVEYFNIVTQNDDVSS